VDFATIDVSIEEANSIPYRCRYSSSPLYPLLLFFTTIHFDEQQWQRVDVVGPICESGDVLGHDRYLPTATKEGDVILISTAGAYGRTMSSTYNMRTPPVEIMFHD